MAEKVRAVILCGSPEVDRGFIKNYLNDGDFIICADSGYNIALSLGIKPDLFVGDFDSYLGDVDTGTEVIKLNTHKDDTDSMHCAEFCVKKGFKEVVLLNASGGRLDHTIANLSVLKYLAENGVKAKIETARETVQFLPSGEYTYSNLNGKTFSVIPFGCDKAVVSYEGDVEYPADNLTLDSSLVIGVSNIFRSDNVKVKILSGAVVFIVNGF